MTDSKKAENKFPESFKFINSLKKNDFLSYKTSDSRNSRQDYDVQNYYTLVYQTLSHKTTIGDLYTDTIEDFFKEYAVSPELVQSGTSYNNNYRFYVCCNSTKRLFCISMSDEDITIYTCQNIVDNVSIKYQDKPNSDDENLVELKYIVATRNGPDLNVVEVKNKFMPDEDIRLSYPNLEWSIDDLAKVIDESNKGLYILSGKPGGGKTSYIVQLTKRCKKSFIFLSSEDVSMIGDMGFKEVILSNPDSVLVIEDGEHAIAKRDSSHYSSKVSSNLLNLVDGITNKISNCQVIITHNQDYDNIDPAFLRPGRLAADIIFNPLTTEQANAFLKNKGSDKVVSSEQTLAELYEIIGTQTISRFSNRESKKVKSIGFKK